VAVNIATADTSPRAHCDLKRLHSGLGADGGGGDMEISWNETPDKRALGKAILHAVSHLVQMMTSTINSAAASVNATYSSDSE
jgi:hypothetical protein